MNTNTNKKTLVYCGRKSKSAKAIANALGIKRIKISGGTKTPNSANITLINWGSSNVPYNKCKIINGPIQIQKVLNKLVFLKAAKDDGSFRIPEWTCQKEIAQQWVAAGKRVLARKILSGCGGKGIIILNKDTPEADFVDAPLYVLYINKSGEYRLHFVKDKNGAVKQFDCQKKVRKANEEVKCQYIRSHSNGYVFQRQNIQVPEDVIIQATAAFKFSGLDFGAVDVIYNQKHNKAFALEINTAPGLEGTTIANYKSALQQFVA